MPRPSLCVRLAAAVGACCYALGAQTGWPNYGHDLAGTRYSALTQIDTKNVAKLVRAWTFHMSPNLRNAGMVYMPFGQSTYDYYGGDRKGANLFGNSLVALDANTGKLKWYFQTIHHDIWDYDLSAPPILFDVVHKGNRIPAVAEIGKTGLLFILDRRNGTPIYGVEKRTVPKSEVAGE